MAPEDRDLEETSDDDVVEMDDEADDQIFIVVAAPHNRRVTVTIDAAEVDPFAQPFQY